MLRKSLDQEPEPAVSFVPRASHWLCVLSKTHDLSGL